ncbi:hypothetical protein [uncultured Shewanella sp.]|uniref:hypothetical protein n=1 Tax=uncultured Shewanella sp. TaxID=173975 RepID=UPI002618C747|nr:hypothetical protein [uncultured Shewanella sp.]
MPFSSLHNAFLSQVSPIFVVLLGMSAHLGLIDIALAYVGKVVLIIAHWYLITFAELQARTANPQGLGSRVNAATEDKTNVITY